MVIIYVYKIIILFKSHIIPLAYDFDFIGCSSSSVEFMKYLDKLEKMDWEEHVGSVKKIRINFCYWLKSFPIRSVEFLHGFVCIAVFTPLVALKKKKKQLTSWSSIRHSDQRSY